MQGGKFSRELREGEAQMETRILESSINKICSLLAVGFGDAGAEVGPCPCRKAKSDDCTKSAACVTFPLVSTAEMAPNAIANV